MLLEAQIDLLQDIGGVRHTVDRERSRLRVAAAAFTGPVDSGMGRIVERIALRVGVGTGGDPAGGVGQLNVPVPPLDSSQIEGEMRKARGERDDGIRQETSGGTGSFSCPPPPAGSLPVPT